MAAPIVTGVVALMLEGTPTLSPAQVKQRLKTTAVPLGYGSVYTTGSGLVSAPAAVAAVDQTPDAATVAVSAGFAGNVYQSLYGQPLVWRDPLFNGGVDAKGVRWSDITWSGIAWDVITWENITWEAFNWSVVHWQDMTWEGMTWEDVTWDTLILKGKAKDKGRKVHSGWEALD
jgi:subtilisin family serine protease